MTLLSNTGKSQLSYYFASRCNYNQYFKKMLNVHWAQKKLRSCRPSRGYNLWCNETLFQKGEKLI